MACGVEEDHWKVPHTHRLFISSCIRANLTVPHISHAAHDTMPCMSKTYIWGCANRQIAHPGDGFRTFEEPAVEEEWLKMRSTGPVDLPLLLFFLGTLRRHAFDAQPIGTLDIACNGLRPGVF